MKSINSKIAVIIPCYMVKNHIDMVIKSIPDFITKIYVVDDCCPESSGKYVESIDYPKVEVLYNVKNLGVGGAVKTGYEKALQDSMDIMVKIDGDNQMDPALIPFFIHPVIQGDADYTKGNRFYDPEHLKEMPFIRLLGNAGLSFINKLVSGYWNIMDPTNGYTAISKEALKLLPLSKISNDYFFESDMLFRLNTIRAVVADITMKAKYADEESSLRVSRVLVSFPLRYLTRFFKRIFYNYFLRSFDMGSLSLISGSLLIGFGVIFGGYHWFLALSSNSTPATTGTVMIAALPIILGFQSIFFFLQQDTLSTPKIPLVRSDSSSLSGDPLDMI